MNNNSPKNYWQFILIWLICLAIIALMLFLNKNRNSTLNPKAGPEIAQETTTSKESNYNLTDSNTSLPDNTNVKTLQGR